MAASSSWLVSSYFSSSLLLHLSPKEQPFLKTMASAPGLLEKGGCTLLLAVILRMSILALAGFLVSLLMLRSNINERMLLGSFHQISNQLFPQSSWVAEWDAAVALVFLLEGALHDHMDNGM